MLISIEEQAPPAPSPALCREVGKECRDCVSRCAETIAFLCPSLEPSSAHALFFKLYPYSGCSGMARSFVREYLSQTEPVFLETAELCA
jgi:hypothetical protein